MDGKKFKSASAPAGGNAVWLCKTNCHLLHPIVAYILHTFRNSPLFELIKNVYRMPPIAVSDQVPISFPPKPGRSYQTPLEFKWQSFWWKSQYRIWSQAITCDTQIYALTFQYTGNSQLLNKVKFLIKTLSCDDIEEAGLQQWCKESW